MVLKLGVAAIGIFYDIKSMEYLFMVQAGQILPFWVLGITAGAFMSVYGESALKHFALYASNRRFLLGKLFLAAAIGCASPITMFGMIPVLMILAEHKISQGVLASFTVSSVLINPNVFIYSFALGTYTALLRLVLCILAGVTAGLLSSAFCKNEFIINLNGFENQSGIKETGSKIKKVLNKLKKSACRTAPNLFIGILLAAMFQLYFPKGILEYFFRYNKGMGVLFSASLGVPVYYCGGGTIPLIKAWMAEGMSVGSVMAFVITGPATKITNLTAIKAMMPRGKFRYYILFIIIFGVVMGTIIDAVGKLIL